MKFLVAKKSIFGREEGNVLFLILIAVALFAALSYAVTSSTRTGGDSKNEGNLITSASITQYPSSVSTSVLRMIISGTGVSELRFNRPEDFPTLDSDTIGVFHPSGGGATYIQAPKDAMTNDQPGDWSFNGELEVPDIATAGVDGNDIVAYLIGIKQSICSKINLEHGLGAAIPVLDSDRSTLYSKQMFDDGATDYLLPTSDVPDIDNGAGAFDGQPFGCFQNGGSGGEYVYYHVVVER